MDSSSPSKGIRAEYDETDLRRFLNKISMVLANRETPIKGFFLAILTEDDSQLVGNTELMNLWPDAHHLQGLLQTAAMDLAINGGDQWDAHTEESLIKSVIKDAANPLDFGD